MNEISFSQGTASDVVKGLHRTAAPGASQSIAAASHDDLVLLARLNDSVVGYLAASTDHLGGLVVWEHVVVEGFRGRGIGRRLLLEAARLTPPMSLITIDPTGDFVIDKVAEYYSRLGFPATTDDRFKISVPAYEVVDKVGEQAEEDTTVESILRRKPTEVVTIAPDAPIGEAIALLTERSIGSVVVSPDGSTIVGILSERDIVLGIHARGVAVLDGMVSAYMTTEVVSVESTEVVSNVMELATIKRLRHLPVTSDGSLVGLVSIGDLLVFRMREHDMRRDRLPFRES